MNVLTPGSRLFLALLTLASPPPGPPATTSRSSSAPGASPVQLQLQLSKHRLTAAEDCDVRIRLTNPNPAPVELADPFRATDQSLTYTLTGPDHPQGQTLTWRAFTLSDPTRAVGTEEPPRLRLNSGQALESHVPLHEWAPLRQPGRYRLEARLEAAGVTTLSEPVEFDVVTARVGPASVGRVLGGSGTAGIGTTWLQEVDGQSQLMMSVFSDDSGEDFKGATRRWSGALGPLEAGSSAVLTPWSNDSQGMSPLSWTVWRKGSELQALAPPATTENPFRFELGAPPERIIHPPLETAAGELFVLVMGSGGGDLRLIRFQSSADATELTPARELGRVRLPGTPVAARATLQPGPLGNGISAVLVEETSDGLDIHHVRIGSPSRGRLVRAASTRIRGLSALPGSEPAVSIDSNGHVRAALVALSMKTPQQAVLAEWSYRPDGRLEAPPQLKPLGSLPGVPRAAVARYFDPRPDRSSAGPDWAILLEDGRLLHSGTAATTAPMTPRNPVAMPLELLTLAQDTMVLTVDPVMGPSFESLR